MNQHQVHRLFEDIQKYVNFSEQLDEVKSVPEQIQGTSFFPGGTGLWCGNDEVLPQLPVGGVMVLGHDFHSEVGYELSRQRGSEDLNGQTWRNLLDFLDRVPIPFEKCFFTNAYMGLRVGHVATGPFPGAKSEDFVLSCRKFFLHQISMQRPTLILALGAYVPAFLAPLSPSLAPWINSKTFRERDLNNAIFENVTFDTPGAGSCVVVSLVHPCLRPSNIRHRRWKALAGDAAELSLVRYAVSIAHQITGALI